MGERQQADGTGVADGPDGPAGTGGRTTVEWVLGTARRWGRMLRADLGTFASDPLPPMSRLRFLRRLPHGVVIVLGTYLTFGSVFLLTIDYRLTLGLGTSLGILQSLALVMALWRPLPAWWLSLAVGFVTAEAVRSAPDSILLPGSQHQMPWPWTQASLAAHALVLLLLALRVPGRISAEALVLTALVTYAVEGLQGASVYSPTGLLAVVVFATVTLLGTALRGRRVARTQLVEQATLTAEERARRTVLEERSRIARELHDVVAHHMSVISIQAQVVPHLVENPSAELRENVEGIRGNALEALTELRRVLGVLRSEQPGTAYGLGSADGTAPDAPQPTLDDVDALVDNVRAAGLEVSTGVTGRRRPLPPGVELSAYRIVQEGLSNALRHAPGSRVTVELEHSPEGVRVRVVNSRPTRTAPPSPGAGHGLLGMRERTTMLGGTLIATVTPPGGFLVEAFLPGPADGAERDGRPGAAEESTDGAGGKTTGRGAGRATGRGSR
ncbi:two component system sensor kinase [Streptomyces griseoaurantiacus M045]|uniref:histidine kinase n=1 Tax=Streptomyces griseoaurantiacus M045 TaxID=996637 RepID=F3NMF4_9ACTN|nr:two component system sensor kinase [Streptomyces griseoaurantiacus M045]